MWQNLVAAEDSASHIQEVSGNRSTWNLLPTA